MTKEVLVSISGFQYEVEADEAIELVTVGNYYHQNGKHFVLYEEVADGETDVTKNTLKIGDRKIEITKKGSSNVHMVFEEGKTNMTYYDTPIGTLFMGISTESIQIKEENEDSIDIKIRYSLEVNYTHVSDCEIFMKVKSNKVG